MGAIIVAVVSDYDLVRLTRIVVVADFVGTAIAVAKAFNASICIDIASVVSGAVAIICAFDADVDVITCGGGYCTVTISGALNAAKVLGTDFVGFAFGAITFIATSSYALADFADCVFGAKHIIHTIGWVNTSVQHADLVANAAIIAAIAARGTCALIVAIIFEQAIAIA